MPTYQMTAPDGKTYRIDGPEGATDDQVRAEIIRQNPHLSETTTPPAQPYQRKSLTETIMNLPVRAAQWMYEHPKETAATAIETGAQVGGGILGLATSPVTGPVTTADGAASVAPPKAPPT